MNFYLKNDPNDVINEKIIYNNDLHGLWRYEKIIKITCAKNITAFKNKYPL